MPAVVPNDWMPAVTMRRIHVHWTAGGHTANSTDKNAYHILVQGDGSLVRGNKSIAANAQGSGQSQASHTLNANTGAVGVSICAMRLAQESPFSAGPEPILQVQWTTMLRVVADLSRRYGIPVTRQTILTHAEVQPNLGIAQRQKWDITRLVFAPGEVGFAKVGDKMRREVVQVLDADSPGRMAMDPATRLPRFRVFGVAPSTLNFRSSPGGTKVGELPEGVTVERIALFDIWSQVRTPGGFVGWVATSFLKPVGG
jgi:hypothetical protein